MPTPAKGLTQPTIGGDNNTWGNILNTNLSLLDNAIGGTVAVSISGNTILTDTQIQNGGYHFTGTLTGNATITWSAFSGFATIRNATTGGFSLICGISGDQVTVFNGETAPVWSDGTDFHRLTLGGVDPSGISDQNILNWARLYYQNQGYIPNGSHGLLWSDQNNQIGASNFNLTSGDQSLFTSVVVADATPGDVLSVSWVVPTGPSFGTYSTFVASYTIGQSIGSGAITLSASNQNALIGLFYSIYTNSSLMSALSDYTPANPYTMPIGYNPVQAVPPGSTDPMVISNGLALQIAQSSESLDTLSFDQPWTPAFPSQVADITCGNITVSKTGEGATTIVVTTRGGGALTFDGSPQIQLGRFVPGRAPVTGDLGPWIALNAQKNGASTGLDTQIGAVYTEYTATDAVRLGFTTLHAGEAQIPVFFGQGVYSGTNDPGPNAIEFGTGNFEVVSISGSAAELAVSSSNTSLTQITLTNSAASATWATYVIGSAIANREGNFEIAIPATNKALVVNRLADLIVRDNSGHQGLTAVIDIGGSTITTWTTVRTFVPSTIADFYVGMMEITISGRSNSTGNRGTRISRWEIDVNKTAPSVALIGSDVLLGTPPQVQLIVSSDNVLVQIQSDDAINSIYSGVVKINAVLSGDGGALWTTF
jgi:hypothetical protein